jgi:hypothetical protein
MGDFRLSRLFNPDVDPVLGDSTMQKSGVLLTFQRCYLSPFPRWNYYPCGTSSTYSTCPLHGHQAMVKWGHLKFPQPTGSASVFQTSASWHEIWSGALIFLIHSSLAHTFHIHFPKIPLIYPLCQRLALFRFILLFHFPQAIYHSMPKWWTCKHWERQWGRRCFGLRCRE